MVPLFALCPKGQGIFFFEGGENVSIQEEAVKRHGMGCNCAQCVLGACGSYTGLDDGTANAVAAGFGGGVRSGEICGAISGAVMALGLCTQDRRQIAGAARNCVEAFRQQFGCVRCVELKQAGVSCDELIAFGAQYVENTLKNKSE